ncbi:MAG: T9SS type A sorting domain-containing protein [Melioribacteraceae bacterium]|nr:T9SS type A sorting domain-containing protein [Melioribacteraceae bacterium]
MANDSLNEYFQLEFHKGSEYDKFFSNYSEYQTNGYNKGLLIWHRRYTSLLQEEYVKGGHSDLEVAVPYMAWEGRTPIPNDSYPYGDYTRPNNWPDEYDEGGADYINDVKDITQGGYDSIAHGGMHNWSLTLDQPPSYFYRPMSKRSDFYTDETIQGQVVNAINDTTRPNTMRRGYRFKKNLGSSWYWETVPPRKSGISIYDIERVGTGENMYMTVKVNYGTIPLDTTGITEYINISAIQIPGTFTFNPVVYWDKVVLEGDTVDHYNIYKARQNPTGFQLWDTTVHTSYRDTTEVISIQGENGRGADVYYYVTTVFNTHPESNPSDTVQTYSNLYYPPEEKPSVKQEAGIPKDYAISQNFPNPFNPSTTIKWQLPKSEHVKIEVFNILGQRVAELVNNKFEAGYHGVNFDASFLPSGVYIYTIKAGSFYTSRKMLLLK